MAHRHLDRLTSFDTSFLANERANGHMAIGAVLVCEGSAPDHGDFLAHIRSRVHQLPRLRQRLHYPPLRLGTPFWVDDPDFDIHRHVRRIALPPPGSERRFRALVGELLAPPLDRRKPLWELIVVEGFEDDRFAIVYKTHHAMADGISAVDIGMLLFDVEPREEPDRDAAPWRPQSTPTAAALLGRAGSGILASLRRLLRWLRRAARDPARARRRAADALAGLWEVSWNLARPAPKVPLNTEISGERDFAWSTFGLADFKHVKNAFGGTVNDVALAVAAGALRRWLGEREVPLGGLELKALVPVSIRTVDEHGELGNKLTAMRGPLPVGIADPVRRLRTIGAAMEGLKSSKQPLGAEAIWGLNDWFRDFAPPLLLAPTAAINFSTRLFNILVTNFPGPQIPFYVLGRELTAIHPVGFLARRHALAIAILSYNGRVSFGLLADPRSLPEVERLVAHLEDSVEELRRAAQIASPDHADELAGDDRPRFARDRERLADA
ncbi:MAG TPA: wax ester/triacylglycerol synthase family O-acyltransferase [Solirubrobacterales bacterium]|jgi:WS/DGAT/MGAT family acyltransferase|nr:wax ester/triacylglycerol synthase family O-acyltransferase [Solirubrobacterales bacterium]